MDVKRALYRKHPPCSQTYKHLRPPSISKAFCQLPSRIRQLSLAIRPQLHSCSLVSSGARSRQRIEKPQRPVRQPIRRAPRPEMEGDTPDWTHWFDFDAGSDAQPQGFEENQGDLAAEVR